jgi:hypothetical protein
MFLSLRMVQAILATLAMDEVIPATVACSLLVKLDLDSIFVDVPVALTALGTLRLPQILRGLHLQRLSGTALDTFDSCETPTGIAHTSHLHQTTALAAAYAIHKQVAHQRALRLQRRFG